MNTWLIYVIIFHFLYQFMFIYKDFNFLSTDKISVGKFIGWNGLVVKGMKTSILCLLPGKTIYNSGSTKACC